jgi:hypothetical protein
MDRHEAASMWGWQNGVRWGLVVSGFVTNEGRGQSELDR